MVAIELAGEAALRVVWQEPPSPTLTATMLALSSAISQAAPESATTAVPGYQSLVVHFSAHLIARDDLQRIIASALEQPAIEPPSTRDVVLPVLYDPEYASDLEWLGEHSGLGVEGVIAAHSGRHYHAYANGFAPGFCYLGEVVPELEAPRLATPRRAVPAGAVGIADRQTGVYPRPSPGGWRIIGLCPVSLFSLDDDPPTRVAVGDRVTFSAITRTEFLALGGAL